jgi:CRP-like cAMP-binding protein
MDTRAPLPALRGPPASCASCPCGRAAGVTVGGRCPFVDRRHPRADRLFAEGDLGRTVWFVKRGAVLLSRRSGGKELARVVRRAGEFVGTEALVCSRYADGARTLEPSVLCGIATDQLERWLGPAGTPARMLLEQTLLANASEPLRGAGADGTATQRVARWVRDAATQPTISRAALASLLGMAPATLSRALTRLAASGAIVVTRRDIVIRASDRLAQLAR